MTLTVCTENQEGREGMWESSWLNGDLRIARDFKNRRLRNNYVPELEKDVSSQKQCGAWWLIAIDLDLKSEPN